MTEKLAVEGYCPECGGKLNNRHRCNHCDIQYHPQGKMLTTFEGYEATRGDEDYVYPAAPTEPTATEKWAREVYRNGKAISDLLGNPTEFEEVLAAAPREVKHD